MTTESQKVGDTTGSVTNAAEGFGSGKEGAIDRGDVNWQFFEASPDGVKILDCDGALLFMNANALKAMEADDYASIS